MPDSPDLHQPQEVAERLEVSAATLLRWSEEFAEFLSRDHQQTGYSDEDVTRLATIKALVAEGLTTDQVRQRLKEDSCRPEGSEATELVAASPGLPLNPAVALVTDALHNVATGQQAVLNSQAANRELLGVVLQDNFNLKEENVRLRERMLDLERQIAQLRRDEESRREALRSEMEARLQDLQHLVIMQTRSGCLGSLLGGR